jgi:drug/metabolite transporter (DMT)-like permease
LEKTEARRLSPARRVDLRTREAMAYLALLFGMLGISFTAIFTKWAAMPGPVAAAYRMSFAAAILALPFAWRLRSLGRSRTTNVTPAGGSEKSQQNTSWAGRLPWRSFGFASLGGVWFGVNLAFLSSALLLTSAATATLLDNTAPIWVGLGAMVLFHERLRGRYWAGLALALAGAAVVSGLNPAHALAFQSGDILAFTGAIFYAAYLLTMQHTRRDLDTVSTLWLVEAGATVALLLMVLVLRLPMIGYPLSSYLAIFAMALISQTGGWLLINFALGYLPASTAVVVLLGQPIVTSMLSIPLLREPLSLYQIAGGALVLTGIYLCVRKQQR